MLGAEACLRNGFDPICVDRSLADGAKSHVSLPQSVMEQRTKKAVEGPRGQFSNRAFIIRPGPMAVKGKGKRVVADIGGGDRRI